MSWVFETQGLSHSGFERVGFIVLMGLMKNLIRKTCFLVAAIPCLFTSLVAGDRILLVVTNHGQLGDGDQSTGYFLSEVAHPWKVFKTAGYEVDFASPRGGFAPMDPKSFDLEDPVNKQFWYTLEAVQGLATTLPLDTVGTENYVAIFFAGGHGTMWDFPDNEALQDVVASIYESGGGVGAVCHGPAALVNVQLSDGSYLVSGRQIAGFTNEEEEAVGLTDTMPFLLETRLKERGAQFTQGPNFQEKVVADGRLVTGQNPASASEAASQLVKAIQ